MYFITTKRMLEVCFSVHPNIQYRTNISICRRVSFLFSLISFSSIFINTNIPLLYHPVSGNIYQHWKLASSDIIKEKGGFYNGCQT